MTTLDERLRDANDALGDAPHVAPPFDAVRRRYRHRRRRALAAGGAMVSIVVVCVAVAFAVRGPTTPPTASSTPPTTAPSTTTTPSPAVPVQRLEDMPRLPASAVDVTDLSDGVGSGRAVLYNRALWFVYPQPNCSGSCAWLVRADLATGQVDRLLTRPLDGQGGGPIAFGDGAVFVATFDYDGSPIRVTRIDLEPRRTVFTVDVPDTQVFGNPKTRLAFGNGALWFSRGHAPGRQVRSAHRSGARDDPAAAQRSRDRRPRRLRVRRVGCVARGRRLRHHAHPHRPGDRTSRRRSTSFGIGFSQSLAADGPYVWTTHWANAEPHARLDLVRRRGRSERLGHRRDPDRAGRGGRRQVWFLGYTPGDKSADPANHYGVVGRIDPETMKVVGVTELPGIGRARRSAALRRRRLRLGLRLQHADHRAHHEPLTSGDPAGPTDRPG